MKKFIWDLSLLNVSSKIPMIFLKILIKKFITGSICGGSFSDRFALKRHQNIHQKYGQTEALQSGIEEETLDEEMLEETEEEVLKEEDIDEDDDIKEEMLMA